MPRQKICPALKEGLRPCVSSLAVPRRLVVQSSHNVLYVPSAVNTKPSQSCSQTPLTESSPTTSYNEEEYCNVNSCRNSQICIKTHPDICPHGVRCEDDECQESGNDRGTIVRIEVHQKPKTFGITIRNEDPASVPNADDIPSPVATQTPSYCDICAPTTHTNCPLNSKSCRISPCPSATGYRNDSTQTTSRLADERNETSVDSSCVICKRVGALVVEKTPIHGIDHVEDCEKCQKHLSISIFIDGGLGKQEAGNRTSSCCDNPFSTQLHDEKHCSTCANQVQSPISLDSKASHYIQNPEAGTHSSHSTTSLAESETDNNCCEKPTCRKIGTSIRKKDPFVDELTTHVPPYADRDDLNKGQDSKVKSNATDRHSASNVESALDTTITSGTLDKSIRQKNFINRSNKEHNSGKKVFISATPEDISPPIRIISGHRVCDVCQQPVKSPTKGKQSIVEESCVSAVCPAKGQIQGCTCRFPPAYKQYGCTGNISGNCDCGK